jgi:uncharacterized protein (TIGR02646 family)
MRKLNRPNVSPACLGNYDPDTDKWIDISVADKYDIWAHLDQMHHDRCAYCEAEIKTALGKSSHIEHFRQRSRYKKGTFEWSNLFGSCTKQDSCGNFKDKQPSYPHQDLIKMDKEDPEDFLQFLPDGSVIPKNNLPPNAHHRATETIRLFNLDHALRRIRETAIKGYLETAEAFVDIALEYNIEDWMPLFEEELAEIHTLAFSTAIKHTLRITIS